MECPSRESQRATVKYSTNIHKAKQTFPSYRRLRQLRNDPKHNKSAHLTCICVGILPDVCSRTSTLSIPAIFKHGLSKKRDASKTEAPIRQKG
eukprot:3853036-Amphidinium_carterae.1